MKKELDPRIAIAVVVVLVLILSVFAFRQFAHSPSGSAAISPQDAGLGKPEIPAGPKAPASGQ